MEEIRGTASGAGGIRVSDFPLKLFYKLCKRFSLQQTLEHERADISSGTLTHS